jgi:shikimate dehydrogenase
MSSPTATTSVAAVIGDPVRHSLSPVIHNAAFEALGLDWVYVALEVAAGGVPEAFAGVRALGLRGLSVTTPHKEAAAAACDALAGDATSLAAVNCVVNEAGTLVGHSTDGYGFVAALRDEAALDPRGCACVVLGAGGAARSIALALSGAGAGEVAVVNRTPARAEGAVALLGATGRVVAPDDVGTTVGAADLVVNATTVGMGDDGGLPLDPSALRAGQVVADIVYEPRRTPLLAAAEQAGARTLDGLPMLVHQAAIAFELWTGVAAPVPVMLDAVGRSRT